jgi:hypothetical protein
MVFLVIDLRGRIHILVLRLCFLVVSTVLLRCKWSEGKMKTALPVRYHFEDLVKSILQSKHDLRLRRNVRLHCLEAYSNLFESIGPQIQFSNQARVLVVSEVVRFEISFINSPRCARERLPRPLRYFMGI